MELIVQNKLYTELGVGEGEYESPGPKARGANRDHKSALDNTPNVSLVATSRPSDRCDGIKHGSIMNGKIHTYIHICTHKEMHHIKSKEVSVNTNRDLIFTL